MKVRSALPLIGHKTGDKVDVTLPNGNILNTPFWVSAAAADHPRI